jgi:hypothetical protein
MNQLKIIWDHVEKLGKRKDGFVIMLDHLFKCYQPIIVETGCARTADNYEGDGMSTILFSHITHMLEGYFISFDIDPEAVDFSNKEIHKNYPSYNPCNVGDSIQNMHRKIPGPIDLLYLDSMDLEANDLHKSCMHCFYEFTTAMPYLKPGSMICADDNILFDFIDKDGNLVETKYQSKGDYIKHYLQRLDIHPIHEEYQVIWQLPLTWNLT